MALAITEPTVELAFTTNVSAYALGAFTPAANAYLVVMVFASGTVDAAPTMAGGSLTWRLLGKQIYNTTDSAYVFGAQAGGSPASCTATMTLPTDAATGCVMMIFSVTGHNLTAPIRQVKTSATTAANPAIAFTNALRTGDATVAGFGMPRSPPASAPPSSGGGWTEIADIGYATPTSGASGAYRVTGDTSSTITFTSLSAAYGALGVEFLVDATGNLAAAGAGTSSSVTDLNGTGKLFGTAAGLATQTAAGKLLLRAQGTTTGLSSSVSDLNGKGKLYGTAVGLGSSVVDLNGIGKLYGTAAGLASSTTDLNGLGRLSGTVVGASSLLADLNGKGKLYAAVIGLATSVSDLNGSGKLFGVSAGLASVISDLNGLGRLSGTGAGGASLTADLNGAGKLFGVSAGTCTITAVGTLEAEDETSVGSSAGTSSHTALLFGTGRLLGASAGGSSLLADLNGQGRLRGTVSGGTLVTGTGYRFGKLSGTSAGSSTAMAATSPDEQVDIAGVSVGLSTVAAVLSGAGRLAGTTAGGSSAILTYYLPLRRVRLCRSVVLATELEESSNLTLQTWLLSPVSLSTFLE